MRKLSICVCVKAALVVNDSTVTEPLPTENLRPALLSRSGDARTSTGIKQLLLITVGLFCFHMTWVFYEHISFPERDASVDRAL